jgi:chorismate mutase
MGKEKTHIPDMDTLRRDIDRVDTALLELIAERMELAQAVRRAKSGVDIWRPSREESHVRHLAQKAGDTSPELVSRIWAELTSASLTLQGPIKLHIALIGDELSGRTLVRDRFGASIPMQAYPTASAALAAAHNDPEGVAVVPAPGGMNTWWTALGPRGAMSDMNILAALPRTGAWEWPVAVAVSKAGCAPSGEDHTLLYVEHKRTGSVLSRAQIFARANLSAQLRSDLETQSVYSVPEYMDEHDPRFKDISRQFDVVKIIGILPYPIVMPSPQTADN